MTQSFGRRALCLVATFTLVNLVVINHPKFKSFLWLPLIFQDVEDVGSASDVLRSSSITTPVSSTIATTTTTTTATTTHTTGGTTSSESILAGSSSAWSTDAAGFPRWGDANGIELDGIFKFVEFASQFDTPRDLLHPTDYPIPNVLYVFGKASSGGTGRAVIAAERGKWKLVPRQFRQERYEPFEHLMMTALNRLLEVASKSSEISHGNSARWSRLRELVRPAPLHEGKQQQHPQPQDQNSIPNETNADIIVEENGGIPMIVHLPDNRYCNYRNYVWNATDDSVEPKPTTRFLNVPIFHVAGAYDPIDCNYTFPIPTYSMIDFVLQNERKASSSSWDDIFREQDRTYAWKSKLSKVVWRGSNTGVVPIDRHLCEKMNNDTTPMRLRMIHAANSNHSNYIASARLFDVKRVPGKMQKQARKQQDGSTATATASSFYLPMQDVQKYKVVLDVDGNSWRERFGKLLCMNSVVIGGTGIRLLLHADTATVEALRAGEDGFIRFARCCPVCVGSAE